MTFVPVQMKKNKIENVVILLYIKLYRNKKKNKSVNLEVEMMAYQFEVMTEEYRREVMDILNYYVEHSFAAYFETKLPYEFFSKFLEMTKGYPAYVIKNNVRVIGFCFLRAYNPLPVFRKTAEITYFIEKNEVGKGIGKEALGLLEKKAHEMGIKHLLASISSPNEQSLRFHIRNGFIECGRFRNIGTKNGESFDVVWMQKDIHQI
jgi:L-amino acid N-acyltransferase YncA